MKKFFLALFSCVIVAGLTYAQDRDRDRDKDQDQIKKRDRIHQEDHLMLLDGTLYQMKQGTRTQVREQVKLNNGVTVNPDGSYQLQNQNKHQLRHGECLDMDGNRYLNQNRFNNRKMMTNRQIERVQTKTMNRPGNQNRGGNRGGN